MESNIMYVYFDHWIRIWGTDLCNEEFHCNIVTLLRTPRSFQEIFCKFDHQSRFLRNLQRYGMLHGT